MIKIDAKTVAELREKTYAPIMECKEALVKSNGNMLIAEEIIRIKLGNKAKKNFMKNTSEGIISSYINNNTGVIAEINCETSFVSNSEEFNNFAQEVAKKIAIKNPKNIEDLLRLPFDCKKNICKTINDVLIDFIARTNENQIIRRFVRFHSLNKLSIYLHNKKIGVIVEYTGNDEKIGKDIAMHIAAMRPISINQDDIPIELIEQEKNIEIKKINLLGKTKDIANKILENKIQKYIKNVSLLNQFFIKDNKKTVGEILKIFNTNVHRFAIFAVGE